jgi:hypothetical protein
MSGRNLGDDDREDQQQQFPLCLASEDAIDQAKDEMMARKFQQELRDIPVTFLNSLRRAGLNFPCIYDSLVKS